MGYHQGEKNAIHIKIKEKKKEFIIENPHNKLYKQLKALFTYLFIEEKDTFLQEIDIIVRDKLWRLPRKIYYYPSIPFLKISHKESIKDYHDRIFSKEIIDKTSEYKFDINLNNLETNYDLDIESEPEEPEEFDESDLEDQEELEEELEEEPEVEEEEEPEVENEEFDDDDPEEYGDYND